MFIAFQAFPVPVSSFLVSALLLSGCSCIFFISIYLLFTVFILFVLCHTMFLLRTLLSAKPKPCFSKAIQNEFIKYIRRSPYSTWDPVDSPVPYKYSSRPTDVDTLMSKRDSKTSKSKFVSAREAIKQIKSGDQIFVHGIAATPTPLLNALCAHALERNLKNIVLWHLHLEGHAEWTKPEYDGIITSNSMFTGANLRKAVNSGRADALPIFLSEIPRLFRRQLVKLDVALIHMSLPDNHGFCTLGTSVDTTRAAIIEAKYKIALVNPNMPRTFGDGIIHSSHIDAMVFDDKELHERHKKLGSDAEKRIGQTIADDLVENGATLQMGIGAIPDAALAALTGHKDLGIHTEMFSDGVLDLLRCGAVTNYEKYVQPGKIVTSFVYGSKYCYNFLHDNPNVLKYGTVTNTHNKAALDRKRWQMKVDGV